MTFYYTKKADILDYKTTEHSPTTDLTTARIRAECLAAV